MSMMQFRFGFAHEGRFYCVYDHGVDSQEQPPTPYLHDEDGQATRLDGLGPPDLRTGVEKLWNLSLLGKQLLIGLTYLSESGQPLGQIQVHGEITRSDDAVVVIDRGKRNGGLFRLPPVQHLLQPAEPGADYMPHGSKVVVHPHYLGTIQITVQDASQVGAQYDAPEPDAQP